MGYYIGICASYSEKWIAVIFQIERNYDVADKVFVLIQMELCVVQKQNENCHNERKFMVKYNIDFKKFQMK